MSTEANTNTTKIEQVAEAGKAHVTSAGKDANTKIDETAKDLEDKVPEGAKDSVKKGADTAKDAVDSGVKTTNEQVDKTVKDVANGSGTKKASPAEKTDGFSKFKAKLKKIFS